jgi:chromosome segregation ATPase
MALSSLREAVSKSERTAAAKDEEIKSLNVLERSRQNELESAGLERDRLRKERDTLNTRLQQAEAECHRLEQELRGLKNGDEQAKSLKREADRLNAALTSMQEDINQIKKEKSELQMMLQSKKFELAREQQEKAVLATAKSELQTALKNTKYEAEKRAHNHGQEFERIVQERADLWAELQDALETAKACQAQADDWSKRFASASTDLSTQDKQKTLLLEELTAKVRKKDEDMKALHEVLADKDMALSSLREAVSKSERTAAAKDEEIKSLKVLERSRQNELESAGLERDRLRKERDTLNTRLQQAEAECHRLEQELQGEITMHQLREEQLAIELKEAKDLYVIIDREVGATKDEVEKFKASAMSQAKAVMTRVTAESRSRLDDAAEQDAFLRDQLSLQDKKLANQDQQLARQAKELKALEDEARLMKTKLEMRDMELRELEDALESSRRSEQDNALWSEAASELANLQEVITELRQSESMQEEELKQAQAETRNAARAAKEKEVELNQLRRMLDSMRSELQISRDKILLEAEIVDRVEAEAKVKLDEAASELKRLNETLEDKNQEIKKYRYQLVTLGKAHAQKKEDYADLVALHEELEEESSYTKQKLQNATSEVERLREELAQRGSRWNRLEQDRSKSAGAHEEKDAHSGVTFDDDLLFGVLDTSDSAPPTGAKNALTDALRPTLRSA